jgi:hypothetical protein
MIRKTAGFLFFAAIILCGTSVHANAQSSSDACSLLTQAKVSAAVGAQVSAGAYMTPSFKTTCTWTATGKIVTLMTEGVDVFQSGKTPISPAMQIVPATGIGDDAYYVVTGTLVSLVTKKGSAAFKISIYAKLPLNTLEQMESGMAQQAASEL